MTNSEKNIVSVTFKPESKSEFHTMYMLVVFGTLISLFLFIIIIQLCKRSKSSQKRNVNQQSSHDTALHSGPSIHENRIGYNCITEQFKDNSYRSLEVHYAEIDESVEFGVSNTSTAQDDDRQSGILYKNSSISDDYIESMTNVFVEDKAKESKFNTDSSSLYLNPVFTPGKPKATQKKQTHMYSNAKLDL